MLPRSFRLKNKQIEEFKRVRSNNFTLFNIKKLVKNPGFATVISKKHIKSSVKRNLLKRRLCYAYLDKIRKSKMDTSFVFYTKSHLEKVPKYKEIIKDICGTL